MQEFFRMLSYAISVSAFSACRGDMILADTLRFHQNGNNANQDISGADASRKSAINIPSISLRKGGGAISGIGEKFSANAATGTASLNVPIFTSPGRSGFG